MRLSVKVVPGARDNAIVGFAGDTLKVRVRAVAERGKANAAVEKLIARALGIPASDVSVVTGHTSPRKLVDIKSMTEADVLAILNA